MALGKWGGLSERTLTKFRLRSKILEVLDEEPVVAPVVFANNCCRESSSGEYCSCAGPPKWMSREQKKRWYGLGENSRRERYERVLKEENPEIDKPKPKDPSWIGSLRRERERVVKELGFEILPRTPLGDVPVNLVKPGKELELQSHWMDAGDLEKVTGTYGGREMTALERINQPDLKGFIVHGEDGRVLNPFETGHVAYRLEMAGIRDQLLSKDGKSGKLYEIIRNSVPLSVELKPGEVSNGHSGERSPNRIYLIEAEGGRKVALNVVYDSRNGRVVTAFVEDATGVKSTTTPAPVRVRELMTDSKKTLANTLTRTPASSRSGPRRGGGGRRS